jgi:hypothetical protein
VRMQRRGGPGEESGRRKTEGGLKNPKPEAPEKKKKKLTASARRLAASWAGPGRALRMASRCTSSWASSFLILSSRLGRGGKGCCPRGRWEGRVRGPLARAVVAAGNLCRGAPGRTTRHAKKK